MKRILVAAVIALLMVSLLAVPASAKVKKASWNVPGDFATIQEAINSSSVAAGDIIFVGPGSQAGALISKSVKIRGLGGAVIDSGPLHGSGLVMGFRLLAGSDNTEIGNLQFKVDLAVMNGAAVNGVTVEHCTFINAVQAVSNWGGNNWKITHNKINDLKTGNGGGIGILIGDRTGGVIEGNLVSHNDITGTLYVGGAYTDPSKEKGGYSGSGIVLYADFRYNAAGASAIKNNVVSNNKVSMVSNNAALVDMVAFEMTDTRDDDQYHILFDNNVSFNDFRGTALQIVLTPDNLADYNNITRNFGENRGHGKYNAVHGLH